MSSKPFTRALTIGSSDSGGGAGIQADLKTFGALGAYGASVITAVTAQNTQGVQAVHTVPVETVAAQCESVLSDIRIDAVKIGLLPDAAAVHAVTAALRKYSSAFTVLDPMLSEAAVDTVQAVCNELLPLSDLTAANAEAVAQLTGNPTARNENDMLAQGRQLMEKGAGAVLLKGSLWEDSRETRDWLLISGYEPQCFRNTRIHTANTYGSGCTLAAAITALRPQRASLSTAVAAAKTYLHGAIEAAVGWRLGKGSGPLAHFWRHYRD